MKYRRRLSIVLLAACGFVFGCAKDIQTQPKPGARTEVVFEPSSTPPMVPTPTDLIRDPASGLIVAPLGPAGTAQAEFDAYLNTLDGFPQSAVASFAVKGELALDPKQPDLAKVVVGFSVDNSDPFTPTTKPLDSQDLIFGYSFDEKTKLSKITCRHRRGWDRGKTYVFVVLGGETGLKDKAGLPVIRSTAFELAAGQRPLCRLKNDTQPPSASNPCVQNYSTLLRGQVADEIKKDEKNKGKSDDALKKLIADTVLLKATSFEQLRRVEDRALRIAEKVQHDRDALILAWSFSIVAMSEANFDPSAAIVPGPANDLLIAKQDDKKTGCKKGLVCIPAAADETPSDAALRLGLNTLDGFSTTAESWASISGGLDPNSVKPTSFLALNKTTPLAAPAFDFRYDQTNNLIVATPRKPLLENTTYVIVGISKRTLKDGKLAGKKAESGLKDRDGNRVVPSPIFALARSRKPLFENGKSQISSLGDTQAKDLEQLRSGYAELFSTLSAKPYSVPREDVVIAWTFTTQSISKPLASLRALPWQVLSAADKDKPQFTGVDQSVPATMDAISSIKRATFTSLAALDPKTGVLFSSDTIATEAKPSSIPFTLYLPKGSPPAKGWPVVVFQHGFGKARLDAAAIANGLAKQGLAVAAFDIIYHGERSVCRADTDCELNGKCDGQSGTCDNKLADSDNDGIPDASGGPAFLDAENPFAIRDNLRQHVIDMAAFLRAITLGAATGMSVTLDGDAVSYVGQSLGAILGTLVMAVDSVPTRAVLNVGGAPLVSLLNQSSAFRSILDGVRAKKKIAAGSLGDRRLLATLQWVADPADPANFARAVKSGLIDDLVTKTKVSKKAVIVQKAARDRTVPPAFTQNLADWIGVSTTDTTFTNQGHGFLLTASPNQSATDAARAQMEQFIVKGTICKPNLTSGQCN